MSTRIWRPYMAVFCAAVVLLCSCSSAKHDGQHREASSPGRGGTLRVIVDKVPRGFKRAKRLSGPMSAKNTGFPDVSARLVKLPEGGVEVGIFAPNRAATKPASKRFNPPNSVTYHAGYGPAGLNVCLGPGKRGTVLVFGRHMGKLKLCRYLREYLSKGALRGSKELAYERLSPLPGTGSVPLPEYGSFSVVSYTKQVSRKGWEDQRSVVAAAFPGDARTQKLLDWWYGRVRKVSWLKSGRDYARPAYMTPVGQEAQYSVPTAHTFAWLDRGYLLIVRCVLVSNCRAIAQHTRIER